MARVADRMNWRPSLLLTSLLVFATLTTMQAQPNLNFKRVTVNWPTIELYFAVGCAGQPAYNMAKQDFKVFENGVEVKDFTLWCPDPLVRCAISVSLVFDASGSMMGSGNAGAKAAGEAFVDMMDGVVDEAAVIWFTSVVTVAQQMTTIKPMLYSAISMLPANGMTAVWDGAYAGIEELINNGVNQCRAVIVMTDGGDNSSTRTVSEIIALANRNRIRVFTIGLGSGINATELQQIALLTGGKYYQTPNASQLAAIYQEISTIIFQGFQECVIMYDRECADGSIRTVELQLVNFCGGTDVKTKTYRAPLDSSTFSDLYMELGDAEGKGNTEVKVPLNLLTSIDNEMFYPFTFTLLYDPACVQLKGVGTPPGSLLEGIPITLTPVSGGAQVRVEDRKFLNGNGKLMEFTFALSDPADTTCCAIEAIDAKFDAGCFIPKIDPGEICIYPRAPIVACDLDAPRELIWQRGIKDYTPNPFSVTGRFFNTGDKEAQNTRYKITYNPADVQLAGPLTDVQTGVPRDIKPGEYSEVTWMLAAKRRNSGDSTEVCITASFDNHEDVTCCVKIYIPPTEPILECEIDVPVIVADNVNLRYVPMPFPVTVTVRNEGGQKTDSVFVEIILEDDLSLAGADAPDKYVKRILPAVLLPNGQGSAQWQVQHPLTMTEKQYIVKVRAFTANAEETICERTVIIPPIQAPILRPVCTVPDSLHFDAGLDQYVPNPFTVKLKCTNNGQSPAQGVTGTIILPANVEFVATVPPQTATQTFVPSDMPPYKPGDPQPELEWQVRWTKRFRYDDYAKFRFTVTGKSFTGVQLDSVETRCEVRVPGLLPLFQCTIAMPDSLPINATETGVEPNPFTVDYTITNKSNQVGSIKRVMINFPPDGLTLNPASPYGVNQAVDIQLDKGESYTFSWLIDVQNRITRRNVRISVIAVDDEGNPVECFDNLPIANLKTALVCQLQSSEPELIYWPVLQDYDPKALVLTATLTNSGGANLNEIVAELEWTDQSGLDLVEFDPTWPDNTNPKTLGVLFPSQTATFQWGVRLKNKNISGVAQLLEFNVKYGSRETPYIADGGCPTYVEVAPVVAPELVCTLGGPDTIRFMEDRYEPTPFDVDVHIANIGTGTARNVKAYLLQDTRFTLVPPSYRELSDIAPQGTVDLLGADGFRLEVNPRDVDGYDTVRAVVVADGVSTTCLLPIYVQRERKPAFALDCYTDATLVFDDVANDYVPNPFPVTTTVRNVGETRAENCELVFVGPPRIMPFDQVTSKQLGTLEVGESVTIVWQMVPLRRDVDGTERLEFQVHGSGGLGPRLHTGTCAVDVFVPAAKAPSYTCDVTGPSALTYDAGSNAYIPNPFVVSAEVTNTGRAQGLGIEAELSLPPGLVPNGPTTLVVPDLDPGSSATVDFSVIAADQTVAQTLEAKVIFRDRFSNKTECVLSIEVPAKPVPSLGLTCASELTALEVDPVRGEYRQGTFEISAVTTNLSGRRLENVQITAIPGPGLKVVAGANPVVVALVLDPDQTAPEARWTVKADLQDQDVTIPILFVAQGEDAQGRPFASECRVSVFVPRVGRPRLECVLRTDVAGDDGAPATAPYLAYNETIGDYEGTPTGQGWTEFTVTAEVRNTGEAMARGMEALLVLPDGVTFSRDTELGRKDLVPVDVPPDGGMTRGVATWKVRALKDWHPVDTDRRFEVLLTSENAEAPTQACAKTVRVQGAPKTVALEIPRDAVGSAGEKVEVPILIGETIGRDVFGYKLTIRFRPEHVRFVDASAQGTLTARGWNGPQVRQYTEPGSADRNLLRVEDFTTGSVLSTTRTGALVVLRFEVVHNPADVREIPPTSPLEFVPDVVTAEGVHLVNSMNGTEDAQPGEITLITTDGSITVSGDCIVPLRATTTLGQNVPNPFNPVTVIEYELGEAMDYTLRLYDAMGRSVRVLEEGHRAAGRYQVHVEAGDLPSGVYIYRLETPYGTLTRRMVLSK